MPISSAFRQRLYPHLETIATNFGTPFHIYDEVGIRETVKQLYAAFDNLGFREYFAVKALPNPHVLAILQDAGCGFDCSSIPELMLARQIGALPENILFTSNNTTQAEFEFALADGGCILNLDDISLMDNLPTMPEIISFRYNPGGTIGNAIIGKPEEAKFGVHRDQIIEAYRIAQKRGTMRFGLHAMVVSNERDYRTILATVDMLLDVMSNISDTLNIRFEFLNIGGGLGIPYHPDDTPLDLAALAGGIRERLVDFTGQQGYQPALYLESGRYVTGSHGVLVTRVINQKDTYRKYIGVDASMSALMRPAIYGAYHHIDVYGKTTDSATEVVDVVGSLCENNDKFAVQHELPPIDIGDLLIIHDTGAHGHTMGFTYNGRLRPQELLLRHDGKVERIRRAETPDDYFATLNFTPESLALQI